jgi:hypothetical protein
MKTTRIISMILFFLLFINSVKAQINEDNWEYPIKPGQPEWKNLKSKQEMTNNCQIPTNYLTKMTTDRLIKLCLDYPLLPDIFFYDNLKEGFETKISSFNGFKELLLRKDLSAVLIKKYIDMQPHLIWSTDLNESNNTFKFIFIELLLIQPSFIAQLSEMQKKDILSDVLKKYAYKKEIPEAYSIFNLKISLFIMQCR